MNCELQQPFVPTVVVESVWESLCKYELLYIMFALSSHVHPCDSSFHEEYSYHADYELMAPSK